MNLNELRKIDPALTADLKAVFAKHGLTLTKKTGRLDSDLGLLRLAIECSTTGGGRDDVARKLFEREAVLFNLQPEWLNRTLVHRHETYRVIGLQPKRHKYPVLVERVSDKKQLLLTTEEVIRELSK